MKLVVLFFLGISLNLIGLNKGAPSYEVKQAVRNVTALLEKIKATSENMFTLEDWINPTKIEKIKKVSEEDHIPEAMKTLIDNVIEQLDATVTEKERIEKESHDQHKLQRSERDEEENIYTSIAAAIEEGNLEEKPVKTAQNVLKYLNRVNTDFTNYNTRKKQAEKLFLDKIYSNTFFTNKLTRAGNSVSNLASIAKKHPKTQNEKKIAAATKKAEKEILKPLIAGLQNKEKKLFLSILRNGNEKNFRKFYDKQMITLGKINKTLNGEEVQESEEQQED